MTNKKCISAELILLIFCHQQSNSMTLENSPSLKFTPVPFDCLFYHSKKAKELKYWNQSSSFLGSVTTPINATDTIQNNILSPQITVNNLE